MKTNTPYTTQSFSACTLISTLSHGIADLYLQSHGAVKLTIAEHRVPRNLRLLRMKLGSVSLCQ